MTKELSFHIEQYTEELIQSVLSLAEAARRARVEFVGRKSIEGDCREARGLRMFDELGRQLRYSYPALVQDAWIHDDRASHACRLPGRESDCCRSTHTGALATLFSE